jgi:CRP/FNR family transcriptional regulator
MRDSSRYPSAQIAGPDRPLQEHLAAEARDVISRQGEHTPGVDILCAGWAYRFHHLPDGNRQILSILHPGDVFSTAAFFESKAVESVAALTDIRFCRFERSELRKELSARAGVFEALGSCFSREMNELNDMAVSLGRRSPDQRVSHFLLQFVKHASTHRIDAEDSRFPFPLLDTDLASALGLAPRTVRHVLTTLQDDNVIDISDGILTVVNAAELKRLADL